MKFDLIIVFSAIVLCILIFESYKFIRVKVFDSFIKLDILFGNQNEKSLSKSSHGVIFFDLKSVKGDFLSVYIYSIKSSNRYMRFKSFNQLCFPLPVKSNHVPFSVGYTLPANKNFDFSKKCTLTIQGYLKSSNGKRKYFRKKIRVLNS